MARKKIYKEIRRPHRWLTESIAQTYTDSFESMTGDTFSITGEIRNLIHAFCDDCGITELEAINIITHKISVKELVAKYRRRRAEYEAYLKAPEDAKRRPVYKRAEFSDMTKWRDDL